MTFKVPAGILAQHVIALGKTRSGKSTTMRVLVEGLLDADKPVCIVDPKGDWWGIKSSADGKKAGYPLVIFGGEHADVPINEHSGAAVAELIATGNRSCLIDLGGWMVGERTRFFVAFASTMFKMSRGARHLVIDEVHNFAPQGKILDPDAGKMLHWANRLASEGLGKGIMILAASQRPQKVHKDFLTSCETLIAKQVIHKLDRDAIKDWIDGCADPLKGKEVMASLAQLKKPQAWIWSPEIEYGPVLVEVPLFKTFDSFKPQPADAPAQLKGWAGVDLSEVTAKLAKVVEETKANNPAELKKRIADLEAQLRRFPNAAVLQKLRDEAATAATAVDPAAVDRAYKDGYDTGVMHAAAKGFDRGYAVATSTLGAIVQGVVKAGDEFMVQLRAAAKAIAESRPPAAPAADTSRPAAPMRPAPRPSFLAKPPISPPAKQVKPAANGDARLSRPQQLIVEKLSLLAGRDIYPASRATLAAFCGVSPSGSGYEKNLGTLKTLGLIHYPTPGVVAFTEAGDGARPLVDDNGQPAADFWLGILNEPKQRIVSALLGFHPNPASREQIAEAAGVSASGSGFEKNLGALKTLGAITYPKPGFVELTKHVMP